MTTARTRRSAPEGTVVAYLRVSTDEQVASGAGLDAQRTSIEAGRLSQLLDRKVRLIRDKKIEP